MVLISNVDWMAVRDMSLGVAAGILLSSLVMHFWRKLWSLVK